ncbi:hypothetical protein BDD12DRAFT_914600 [Trichophaea hybrida]|nr:hypothetical protein BDD12DRAFT_914600 [Trichophaea hybrida]
MQLPLFLTLLTATLTSAAAFVRSPPIPMGRRSLTDSTFSDLLKRGSDIGITMYASSDCSGAAGHSYPNIIYLEQNLDSLSHNDFSLKITGRNVNPDIERLYLARSTGSGCHDVGKDSYVSGVVGSCARGLPAFNCVILRQTGEVP